VGIGLVLHHGQQGQHQFHHGGTKRYSSGILPFDEKNQQTG
jgi:hypothetical protein